MLLDGFPAPRKGPRAIPVIVSLAVHVLAFTFLGMPDLHKSDSAYKQLIRPREEHLVWYQFKKTLPDVSPAHAEKKDAELKAEVKIEKQSIVSSPKDAPKAQQMIFLPAPELKPQVEQPLPNVLALAAPPPKVFVAPPVVRPVETPRTVPDPEAAPELKAALKTPDVFKKPFVPPPAQVPKLIAKFMVVPAPEINAVQPLSSDAAQALRQGSHPLAFRPKAAPSTTAGAGTLPDAPVLDNAPATATLAIVGLNPLDNMKARPPDASRAAQFSGGPKINPNGATSSGNTTGVAVPDLTVRGDDRAAAKALIAKMISPSYNSPTSPETLRAVARENAPSMRVEGALPVSGAPDQRFLGRQVFSVALQMANLTSHSGSWLMWYADRELLTHRASMGSPEPLHKVDPKYIAQAAEERIEGTVRLAFVIGADGRVSGIEMVRGVDARLNRSAEEALSKWVFSPATRDGKPVAVDALVDIPFRLAPVEKK